MTEKRKKKCIHIWTMVKLEHIMPGCNILDCTLDCAECGKRVSGKIHIDSDVDKETEK